MATSILERAGRRIGPAGTADAARGRRLLVTALRICAIAWIAWQTVALIADVSQSSVLNDAAGYWATSQSQPYAIEWGQWSAFPYSPAALHALWPLQQLPLPVFIVSWYAMQAAILLWLVGPWWAAALMVGPAIADSPNPLLSGMWWGNITLPLAAVVALMPRWPAVGSAILLTKFTIGVTGLWFVFRGEWRRLGIALAVTSGLVLVSVLIAPGLWPEWIAMLSATVSGSQLDHPQLLPLGPLWLRMGVAAVLVLIAARTDRRWLLGVAAFLSQPALWPASLVLLLAIPRLASGRRVLPDVVPRRALPSDVRVAVMDDYDTSVGRSHREGQIVL